MSIRANVVIDDGFTKIWFYRHYDGYPKSVARSLKKLINWYQYGYIRKGATESAGWLILIGALEYSPYGSIPAHPHNGDGMGCSEGWKVGAYEPTTGQHEDIEYQYTIDTNKHIVKIEAGISVCNISFTNFLKHGFGGGL